MTLGPPLSGMLRDAAGNYVSRHDIAGIWVAFFPRRQRYLRTGAGDGRVGGDDGGGDGVLAVPALGRPEKAQQNAGAAADAESELSGSL